MSLVGPRPTLQAQVDRYSDDQRRRLDAHPGLTGWAQVNGRASLPWARRIELDVWYIEHATLRLDLRIIALSVRMAITGHGLYRGETGGCREPPAAT
jgi:lipopolysaccharide/colanic/teichoic acid biosynthesis glycosyltransferase